MRKKLLLVDASNQFHRAFYNPSGELNAPDGFPTTGLHGFFQIISSIEKKYEPDHILLVFDKGKSFRSDIFPEYKGNRPKKSDDFKKQWAEIVPLCQALGYPCYKKDDGYEADDIIGALTVDFQDEMDVIIFSADKDFAQLVNENVYLLQPKVPAGYSYRDKANVEKKYGVSVSQILDLFTLIGDTADNIPGINGVGQKTAQKYLTKYGTWRGVFENASNIGGKRGAQIAESKELLEQSNKLITIVTDIPHGLTIDNLSKTKPEKRRAYELCIRFGLKQMVKKLDLKAPNTIDYSKIKRCTELTDIQEILEQITDGMEIGVDIVFSKLSFMNRAPLVFSLAFKTEETQLVSFFPEDFSADWKESLQLFWDILANENIAKICHHPKDIISWMKRDGREFNGLKEDLHLLDYLDQRYMNHKDHSLSDIASRLGLMDIKSLKDFKAFKDDAEDSWIEELAKERIWVIWALKDKFRLTDGMREVYQDIEIPCIPVLAEMEHHGILVSVDQFKTFIAEISVILDEIEIFIEEDIGRKINIRSPKQLSELLYKEKGYTPSKKTKSGGSTDSASLQDLMQKINDPILEKILEYRELYKIKSTYLETLPTYIDSDGRIHTQFHQAVTATGRLSSSDPNLQNIPVRKAWGRKIRECFIPAEGKVLISADYSQIEMRILAHYCQKGTLVDAFQKDEDIHRRTGVEIAGGELFYRTEHRAIAKMINYGLIYGMSSFRLARELKISRKEADGYIERYFKQYPEVKKYLDQSILNAEKNGVSTTLWGRERMVLGINSENSKKKDAGERIALNAPIQGTAADIMKIAMINVFQNLKEQVPSAKILLQVHDELLIEVEENLASEVASLLQSDMEGAGTLAVPITVNVEIGKSWSAIH
jgi:DNA polymerase I